MSVSCRCFAILVCFITMVLKWEGPRPYLMLRYMYCICVMQLHCHLGFFMLFMKHHVYGRQFGVNGLLRVLDVAYLW